MSEIGQDKTHFIASGPIVAPLFWICFLYIRNTVIYLFPYYHLVFIKKN